MQIYTLYESIIVEAEVQSCVKKFGHILFGDQLSKGKEKNTNIEDKYAEEIKDFTDNMYGEETTPEFLSAMKNLKGCMSQYSDVLVPEKSKVYRGLTLPINYFIKNKKPIETIRPFPYTYKASNPIQSWTNNFDIAATFGSHDILNEISQYIDFSKYSTPESRQQLLANMSKEGLTIAFILEYSTNPQEFIFKSKYFKMLSMAQHEDELIRISNKPIQVIAKFNEHEDAFLTANSLRLIKYINQAIDEA